MDLSNYKAFIAVADHNSFSKASEVLYITQPAVSKRIALLEDQLGSTLFDRIGRKVILNEAGKALLPVALRIMQEVKESQRIIDNLSGEVSGHLSLVTSHHIGLHRLPKILKKYAQDHPQVRLDLAFMDSENACRMIEKGDYELGVVTLPLKPSKRLKTTKLWNDPLAIAVSPSHPLVELAKLKTITLNELAKHSAILPAVGTYTRTVIEKPVIQKHGALDVILETNYLETIHMMVSIGLGWSALPRTMLDDKLIEIPVKGLNIERTLGIVQHAGRSLSNAGKVFIDCLAK
ncbi:MAG: LysR family transcriptional regulator [Cocleimonas sp.]